MKMKAIDASVTLIFVLALVIIYFFWGCRLDAIVTAIAAVIVIASALAMYFQYKRIHELEEPQN
ncbi:MAG TPA: hypothetical protein VJZ04_10040 [Lachnospiraceae bacterium]|nr:hypothetical protein [Lachnospiraceae bacterium]